MDPINMPLRGVTGPVLGRCCQHRTSTGPVPAPIGMFTGESMKVASATMQVTHTVTCTRLRFCHNRIKANPKFDKFKIALKPAILQLHVCVSCLVLVRCWFVIEWAKCALTLVVLKFKYSLKFVDFYNIFNYNDTFYRTDIVCKVRIVPADAFVHMASVDVVLTWRSGNIVSRQCKG